MVKIGYSNSVPIESPYLSPRVMAKVYSFGLTLFEVSLNLATLSAWQ
jgi:hypothetical protein